MWKTLRTAVTVSPSMRIVHFNVTATFTGAKGSSVRSTGWAETFRNDIEPWLGVDDGEGQSDVPARGASRSRDGSDEEEEVSTS